LARYFLATGTVYLQSHSLPGYPQLTPRVLFRNLGNGTFEEMEDEGPGIATTHSSHRCAFGDFDNDGDLNIDRQPE
jgi:hypothetical protein